MLRQLPYHINFKKNHYTNQHKNSQKIIFANTIPDVIFRYIYTTNLLL